VTVPSSITKGKSKIQEPKADGLCGSSKFPAGRLGKVLDLDDGAVAFAPSPPQPVISSFWNRLILG